MTNKFVAVMAMVFLALLLITVVVSAQQGKADKGTRAPGSTTARWGNISGDINSQTDLMQQFSAKQNALTGYPQIVTLWNASGACSGFLKNDGTCATPTTNVQWGQITGTLFNQSDLGSALNAKANLTSPVSLQSGVSYTLSQNDNGAIVAFNNQAAISLTLVAGIQPGFSCLVLQLGAGQINFSGSSVTIQQRQKFTKSAGQYAVVSVISYAPNTFVLSGDMAQ